MAKNVVITGATSGIGEAIARAYLEQGENVVLTGRRTDRLEVLKAEFAEASPNQTVWTFPLDVTNYDHGEDCLLQYSRNDRED